VVRVCDTALYAASAREKAIACSSTVARCRCNSKDRSDGNASAQRRTLGIPAEFLTASHRASLVNLLVAAALRVILVGKTVGKMQHALIIGYAARDGA
jgi:hypothetical protein